MNIKKEIKNISDWMKEYLNKSGMNGFVIGLSGGLDSSVVACLAVKAIKKENVVGIIMPCYSNEQDAKDAETIANFLNINYYYWSIDYVYNMITRTDMNNSIALANLKSRLRMVYLYYYANNMNYLVAGTGNLSELQIGYATKFGDGGVDMEPIGNYYKTEVYEIAKELKIPEQIIKKAPSAGLWEDQTDEDEIGMTYKELDIILKAINKGESKLLDKFDIDKIEKVQHMIKKAKHKNALPPRYEKIN